MGQGLQSPSACADEASRASERLTPGGAPSREWDGAFPQGQQRYVVAFDTANEVIAIGLGVLHAEIRRVQLVASVEVAAHRASNTQLLPRIDALLRASDVTRDQLACIACGRGPGSFTGVRIAMATAKGIAAARGVALVGVSSLDAVAYNVQAVGVRGPLAVMADAMRKEVYPVRYVLGDEGVQRLNADRVVKVERAAEELVASGGSKTGAAATDACPPERERMTDAPSSPFDDASILQITGDALVKYADLFAPAGTLLESALWTPTGRGLLAALEAAWRADEVDPFDAFRHNPAFALPVYTRLSDAEENERIRLAKNDPKNLAAGVQDVKLRRDQRATLQDAAVLNARPGADGVTYKPLDAAHAGDVAALEARVMAGDAWNERLIADELPRTDRLWWAAYAPVSCWPPTKADTAASDPGQSCDDTGSLGADVRFDSDITLVSGTGGALVDDHGSTLCEEQVLVGYAGGWVVEGGVQILKVGVDPVIRRHGIARELLARLAADARDLGAETCSLEVRTSNIGARTFYRSLGLHVLGKRPRYYNDGEDAVIMAGPLPLARHDVAGMTLQVQALQKKDDPATTDDDASAVLRAPSCAPSGSSPVGEAGDGAADQAESPARTRTLQGEGSSPKRPLILAIESSCDETAAALVDGAGNLVADVVASQIDFHARFGGVVPEIASRKHVEAICGVCDECFDIAAKHLNMPYLNWEDVDAVAVTYAPGLLGALVVGVAFAKGAAWAADVPFIGVNHLEGHVYANKIDAPAFAPPAVISLLSGGNTLLVHMKDWGDYETLGATIDDAVGEAFDKVAKALGLGYPGGPVISRYAASGNPQAIAFPRAMMHSGDLRFSLSGLKTAVITYLNNERAAGRELNIPDIAASFQQAVVDVQVKKAEMALRQTGARELCLGGGVAANSVLRDAYQQLCDALHVRLTLPPLSACGDNAAMIALVALDRYRQGRFFGLDADAQAHASLDEPY